MEKRNWVAYHKSLGWVYCEKKAQEIGEKLILKILETGVVIEDADRLNISVLVEEERYFNTLDKNLKEFEIQKLIDLKRKNNLIKNVEDLKDYEKIVFYKKIFKDKGVKSLFHFTAAENSESIMDSGFLYSIEKLENKGKSFLNVSNIISRSIDYNKKLRNYVRLCYNSEHPMMHSIKKRDGINRFLIIEINKEIVFYEKCLFSDINAADKNAEISSALDFIEKMDLSYATLKMGKYLSLDENGKKKFQSEILVFEKISKEYFLNYYIREI